MTEGQGAGTEVAQAQQQQDATEQGAEQTTAVLQEWVPLTHCFDWHLGQMAFQHRGAQAFTTNEVPNLINQGGMSAYRAAEVLFANCQEADAAGTLEDEIVCLEMAIGLGLHTVQVLDRFKEHCEAHGADYYGRLVWYATDITPKMLQDAQKNGVFERHADRVVLAQLDALQPEVCLRLADGEQVELSGRVRAVFHTYMLCVLPANVFRRSELTDEAGTRRVVWGILMARTLLRHTDALATFTDLSIEEIRAIVDSGDSDEFLKVVNLYPLLDLDLTLAPMDESSHPDLWELERIAQTIEGGLAVPRDPAQEDGLHTWVLHSAGAMQSLDRTLKLLRPDGFLLYRDYGPATAEAANGTHLYQHYGATTAIGINHYALDSWLQVSAEGGQPRARVTVPDNEAEAAIKTRLVGPGAIEKTRATFARAFDHLAFEQLTEAVQKAREAISTPQNAMEMYRQALVLERDNWALLSEAGEIALRSVRNLEMAHMLIREALRINPWYHAYAWNLMGDVFWFAGEIDRSEAAYEKAITCNPENYRGYFNLYTIHRQRGRYDKAVEMAAMALAMDRDGAESERTRAALEDATRLLRKQRELAVKWRKERHAGSPL